ncbi:MAG: recombinase family protein [Zoogloea oleivorans]|jgi:putative DNA-invertase from lambdoid prophage Rac|uniref:recombinase family protein n=1 Tax=Zoogloea oleivorans TaxID=1552750 RepID=UPI002A3675BD|nr:recombinase family protein [Zoogloea oleivorans]MDY0035747.1 recombinase family protein [Zoogloea oleivorans]
MSAVVAYARVSTDDQTCENQRRTIAARYAVSKWFTDDGVSGAIAATQRPALAALLAYVREGDAVVVAAIDRLGRNTIDVLSTVEALRAKGVSVVSMREGFDLATPAGKLMLTMLAAVAELERENLKARQFAGLERAKAEGKHLGRTKAIDDAAVLAWRAENAASIKATAEHFGISAASVKRACSKA